MEKMEVWTKAFALTDLIARLSNAIANGDEKERAAAYHALGLAIYSVMYEGLPNGKA